MLYDIFYAALEWTAEYREWGWNAATVSVILMAIFTVTETWGIIEQGRTIWRKRSGEAVSAELFLFTCPFFMLCGVYGYHLHGAVMIANCVITAIAQLPILVGLARFAGFSERERKIGSAYALLPFIEIWTDHWELVYMASSLMTWWAFFEQLRKLWDEWKTGAFDIKLYLSYFLSVAAWFVYAVETGDTFFTFAMSGGVVLITSTILLWCWLRAHEPQCPRVLVVCLQLVRKVLA